MHILRVCIQHPGDTAERLLTVLEERCDARFVGREPSVRGLVARQLYGRRVLGDSERDRGQELAEVERNLDEIARELRVDDWRETLAVD